MLYNWVSKANISKKTKTSSLKIIYNGKHIISYGSMYLKLYVRCNIFFLVTHIHLTASHLSGKLSFIFDRPLICMQLSVLTNRTTYICLYSLLKSKIIADWWLENINPEITQNGVLLDVSVFPGKNRCNKHGFIFVIQIYSS
jgi:hypothetical protein